MLAIKNKTKSRSYLSFLTISKLLCWLKGRHYSSNIDCGNSSRFKISSDSNANGDTQVCGESTLLKVSRAQMWWRGGLEVWSMFLHKQCPLSSHTFTLLIPFRRKRHISKNPGLCKLSVITGSNCNTVYSTSSLYHCMCWFYDLASSGAMRSIYTLSERREALGHRYDITHTQLANMAAEANSHL